MAWRLNVSDWIGRTLSKVTIQKLLGRGGMAEVYLGVHTTLNRQVAVKILHGHLLDDDTLLARFRSEAQSVAAMRHPNIVQVFDFDIVDDRPYIVMELLEGPSLEDYQRVLRQTGKILPMEVTARLITAIASALDYAHAHGVIHRDVKPSNILLRREAGTLDLKTALPPDVQPVLTDFGVARMANTTVRTASGAIVGTPAYMSPEQVSGVAVDARSDIYSLGVVLYEMLSGRLPFGGEEDTVASTLIKHITEPPAPLNEVPPAVQAVVFRALAKDPNARFQSAGALANGLRAALNLPLVPEPTEIGQGRPAAIDTRALYPPAAASPRRNRSRAALTGIVVLALIAIGAVALLVINGNGSTASPTGSNGPNATPEQSYGFLAFSNRTGEVDRVDLHVEGFPTPPPDMSYEVWMIGGESRRSIGVLEIGADGTGTLTFVDDAGENLLATYDEFEITVEPDPDPNPLPTGDVAFSGAIPPGPLVHIRHLLVSFSKTPDAIGLTTGLMRDAALIWTVAQSMQTAQNEGNLAEVVRQAEGLVNLIEGDGGTDYGDLNGDGEITNPGDVFGLLPGARAGGYIQSGIDHARFATESQGATAYIFEQAAALETTAQNLGGWAAQLRNEALSIVRSSDLDSTEAHVQAIFELADRFTNGQDANGNGEIEPIPSEGGAQLTYHYALRMADMPILAGPDRMPAPFDGTTTPASMSAEHEY
jgi:serine/threonine protein kinase